MNLRSSLRTLAFASVCALPLPAGVVTINFTQTGGDVVVTLSGSLTDATAWIYDTSTVGSPQAPYILPNYGQISFGAEGDRYSARSAPTGSWTGTGFGPGVSTIASQLSVPGTFTFARAGEVVLPTGYSFSSPTNLNATMTFTGKTFTDLGITATPIAAIFGGDEIRLTFTSGGGGGSSVPDAGPGPVLALLLGGLGLRQWHSSRRSRAAA